MGHDLGHTPFGHAGERALNQVFSEGFAHHEQSVRIVEKLEKGGRGTEPDMGSQGRHPQSSDVREPSTLEGRVVRYSDKIAYINHDVDDAIRAGIIREEDLPRTYTDILGHSTRERLNT